MLGSYQFDRVDGIVRAHRPAARGRDPRGAAVRPRIALFPGLRVTYYDSLFTTQVIFVIIKLKLYF